MKTNILKQKLIEEIKEHSIKENSNFWKRIVKELEKPTRRMREVNIEKLNKHTKANETVLVPGKVLSIGEINHKLTIAAFAYTESAEEKLKDSIISIQDLIKKDPKGKKIKIIG
jgi:large subunit ribosomal protein L18e|tara:strand:+ start:226 stop:567 length:342 start_codon:yes stop_codon:yes gene_type:complete